MFERYTDSARHAIFLARQEASARGAPSIEPECLLLGLLRADDSIVRNLLPPQINVDTLRSEFPETAVVSAVSSVDLPLSQESKRVLAHGMHESERIGDRYIGCEHLLLGLMSEDTFQSARLLKTHGVNREQVCWLILEQRRNTAPIKREEMHALVDSLPDGAIEDAGRMLRTMQVWPLPAPQIPRRIAELQQQLEHRRGGISAGSSGVGGGGGSWSTNSAGDLNSRTGVIRLAGARLASRSTKLTVSTVVMRSR
jgi:ATP-dependent Clp protease ATP-binding subunit ClpA